MYEAVRVKDEMHSIVERDQRGRREAAVGARTELREVRTDLRGGGWRPPVCADAGVAAAAGLAHTPHPAPRLQAA